MRRRRAGLAIAVLALALALTACAAPASGSSPSAVPVSAQGGSVVIGALPQRQSLVLHGTAKLVIDPALEEDLRTFAKQTGKDPDDVVRDYAAEQYLDKVDPACRAAHVTCDAAVFHPGVHGASEVRFATRPPQALLDRLRAIYPRDLEIEWGDGLLTDEQRDHFASVVTGIVEDLPGMTSASAGFPASGALDVEVDGTLTARQLADAISLDRRFRATFVDGRPPTEVIVTARFDAGTPKDGPNTTPPASDLAACAPAQVRPFDCDSYELERPGTKFLQFEAWFDVLHGVPRLVVGESEHLRVLPVRFTTTGATAAPIAGWTLEQRACFRDTECGLDEDVEKLFTSGASITADGSTIRIAAGSTVLVGTSNGGVHRYSTLTRQIAGGITLLTYHQAKDGLEADAADGGKLTVDKAGCLTDGTDVLVLPDTTVLHPDGSIDIGGRHVPVGGTLKLGGGEGAVPADQHCGNGGYWYGYGA